MAFDITPYIDMKPSEVRKLIREGVIDFPTAGMCRGYAQANLIILPPEYAGDFEEFARRNPFPCPILEIVRGTPETHDMGEGGNICTDIPKYRIYRDGKWDGKELTDVSGYWKEGYVGFLIGCSFSFEEALMREGIEVRHIAQGRNVPMFKTNIMTEPAGPFCGPKLTTRDLQKFYNDLQSNGRLRKVQKKEKPGLSNSTVRGIHMMLHNALDRAVKEKLILSNPTENCIIPKIEKQEMKILHPDHISAYLNAAERRNALPMFYLELVSGLRKGELVALQWSDLDEANCTISVSKQASWDTEHQLILSRPKTGNSIREVSIPQDAVELLKQEHAKHPGNPWMFPSGRTGEMYHPDSVVTLHKRILKDAGLEHIRFHDLRHTFATLALQNGVDVKTVSSMLGHYDAGFTLRTYTHVTRQMQQKAAEKMGSFMAQIR